MNRRNTQVAQLESLIYSQINPLWTTVYGKPTQTVTNRLTDCDHQDFFRVHRDEFQQSHSINNVCQQINYILFLSYSIIIQLKSVACLFNLIKCRVLELNAAQPYKISMNL